MTGAVGAAALAVLAVVIVERVTTRERTATLLGGVSGEVVEPEPRRHRRGVPLVALVPIGAVAAAIVGYRLAGIAGSLAAVVGVWVLPRMVSHRRARRRARRMQEHLADAVDKGATVLAGGTRTERDGLWFPPTVVVDVDHTMDLMTEETFGPVLPVMPFEDVDEAVRMANDTTFGLSAAVLAGTVEEALAVAGRIEAGAVSINDAALTAVVRDGEKHSAKASGLGASRMGPASLHRFLRRQAFLINGRPDANPWWFHTESG